MELRWSQLLRESGRRCWPSERWLWDDRKGLRKRRDPKCWWCRWWRARKRPIPCRLRAARLWRPRTWTARRSRGKWWNWQSRADWTWEIWREKIESARKRLARIRSISSFRPFLRRFPESKNNLKKKKNYYSFNCESINNNNTLVTDAW